MVIVDTSVFSKYLRRRQILPDVQLAQFLELLEKDQVVLVGGAYQELLSGIRHQEQFNRLADVLDGFDIILAEQADHLMAGAFYNRCRAAGVQGSATDFLICAMAVRRDFPIFTTDEDFVLYSQHVPIALYG